MRARRYASPVLALGLSLFFTDPTFAQTAPAPAPAVAATPAAPATTPAAPELDTQGRPKAKAVRAACKADAETKSLTGDDKRRAVTACVIKQRPDLAGKLEAKQQCRVDGEAKDLKKDALKRFVKDCAKTKA